MSVAPGSETVTFLMTDIEGATRLWETEPEVMRLGLRRHDEVLRKAVEESGGAVAKHAGDGIMAVFEGPAGAVRAAVSLQRELHGSDLNFKVRVGVWTGTAERVGDDWFGSGPSRAARVMGVAHGGQIIVSESTAALVRADLDAEVHLVDLGVHELRGIAEPVGLWQVGGTGLTDTFPAALARLDPALLDVFVGRERELDVLRHVLARALGGTPSIGLVVGEAGIGKSRLVDELVAHARRQGMRILRGEAVGGDATPFGVWTGVLRALVVDQAGSASSVNPSDRRWELLDLLADGLSEVAPSMVVVEDLHWADESSLWVLERLTRRLGSSAVALVGTTRPDEPDAPDLAALRRVTDIVELPGLDVSSVQLLARSLGAGPHLDLAALCDRTGGNPLFVRELLALRDREGRLPEVVRDLLSRSLERLTSRARRTLGALALAGGATPPSILASALGLSSDEALSDLEEAADMDIVRVASGPRAEFRHALFAEAALATLSPADQRDLHEHLAEGWGARQTSLDARVRRAHHLVAALPNVGASVVGGEVLSAVRGLRAAGEEARAAELARVGVQAIADDPDVPADVRARLGIELGEALDSIGDKVASTLAFEQARTPARATAIPEIEAMAELGAVRYVYPFMPQLDRLHRLAEIEARLPDNDNPLRADLLGRMCVLGVITPGGVPAAHARGDAAVEMARRLGDPTLVTRALSDRHLVPAGAEGYDRKAVAADELIELGERLHHTEVLLHGYEWRTSARLDRLDLAGAEETLDRFEALAQLMPAPRWRYAALVRRVAIDALRGRRADALANVERAAAVGPTFQDPETTDGFEVGGRSQVYLLWRVPDERFEEVHRQMSERTGHIPSMFLQIKNASAAWALGDEDAARRCVDRYAEDPTPLLSTMEGPALLNLLAAMAADVAMEDHVPALRAVLLPFEHRLCGGNTLDVYLPIATTLGRLALVDGDTDAALAHHETAVRLVRAMRSPPLLALCLTYQSEAQRRAGDKAASRNSSNEARDVADEIGLILPDDEVATVAPTAVPGRRASLVRSGAGWSIQSPHGAARIGHSLGIEQLARLLAQPGREFPANELAGVEDRTDQLARDLGPALDARAKREYRQRVSDLQEDIDEADANNDLERSARARAELDTLLAELRHAIGLGGRDRPIGSGAERARVNVTRSIRRAITGISDELPELGGHLANSVRTGRYCSYSPEPAAALGWTVTP